MSSYVAFKGFLGAAKKVRPRGAIPQICPVRVYFFPTHISVPFNDELYRSFSDLVLQPICNHVILHHIILENIAKHNAHVLTCGFHGGELRLYTYSINKAAITELIVKDYCVLVMCFLYLFYGKIVVEPTATYVFDMLYNIANEYNNHIYDVVNLVNDRFYDEIAHTILDFVGVQEHIDSEISIYQKKSKGCYVKVVDGIAIDVINLIHCPSDHVKKFAEFYGLKIQLNDFC